MNFKLMLETDLVGGFINLRIVLKNAFGVKFDL